MIILVTFNRSIILSKIISDTKCSWQKRARYDRLKLSCRHWELETRVMHTPQRVELEI